LCIGVAFQGLCNDAENIGYIIPSEILVHFLEDYSSNGCFTGFGTAGFQWQDLESSVIRQALRMKRGETGVRVKDVDPSGPASGIICPDDVLLSVDGQRVGNDGTVAFLRGRIPFTYLMNGKFAGDMCKIQVLRSPSMDALDACPCSAANRITVDLKLQWCQPLVAHEISGPPAYLIIGGLVFVPLTEVFLKSEFGEQFADKKMPIEFLQLYMDGSYKEALGHQAVVLTQVLASNITIGYTDIEHKILDCFNGVKIRNLRHLADLVEACKKPYLRFQFRGNDLVVLEREQAQSCLRSILAQNMIPAACSGI